MRNLKVWQKLALMGGLFLIPFGAVTYKMTSSINGLGLESAQMEVRGLEYYGPALTLVKDLQLHRDLAHARLEGDTSFDDALARQRTAVERDIEVLSDTDRRLSSLLHTTESWAKLRTAGKDLLNTTRDISADESFARHSRLIADLIALLARAGHASHLTLDSDVDRKRLIDVLVMHGPGLSESLARARGFGASVVAQRETDAGTVREPESRRRPGGVLRCEGRRIAGRDAGVERTLANEPRRPGAAPRAVRCSRRWPK